jgi:hypothetical protein
MEMIKKILLAASGLILSSVLAMAMVAPNFSGTWVLDQGRSYSVPQNMTQTLTISHKEDQIEIETKIVQPGNERVQKDTYILDGKEHEFTPQVPAGQPQPKGKRTASWLPGQKGITATDVTTVQNEKGTVTTQILRKWTISAAGELVVDMYIDNANGSFETKRIFKKQ